MYCPKCATQNADDAKFCRACGANISLVPQALTGRLPTSMPGMAPMDMTDFNVGRRHRRREPTIERGIKSLFSGLGFIFVAISIALFGRHVGGEVWWYWMLIPAFSLLGGGVAEIMRAKRTQALTAPPPAQAFVPSATASNMPRNMYVPSSNNLPTRDTADLVHTPPSVTEATTRHLGNEAATQLFERPREKTGEGS